jgi:hypothetical protein
MVSIYSPGFLHWYCFLEDLIRIILQTQNKSIMNNPNKNKSEQKEEMKQSPAPQTTTPVNRKSGDKLRENPSNDEETIAQTPRKSEAQQTEQSPLTRQHDDKRNQVTNEEDQEKIVNPMEGDWDKKVE